MVKVFSSVTLLLLALGSGTAQAAPVVTFNNGAGTGVQCATTTATSQPAFNAMMMTVACAGSDGTELYKSNVGGNEVGLFAAAYSTEYFNTPNDPKDATISWVLSGDDFISCAGGCWLGVKDGASNPAAYGFAITGWDGKSSIFLTDFWPGRGAISNVSIWTGTGGGGGDDNFDVSAPGTLALAGLGLIGAAFARRRRAV